MGTIVKKGTFDMQDRLDKNIDKLTLMMSKLIAQDDNKNKQFKPKIYQGKQRRKSRNNYDQVNYQNRYRLNTRDRRTLIRGRVQN